MDLGKRHVKSIENWKKKTDAGDSSEITACQNRKGKANCIFRLVVCATIVYIILTYYIHRLGLSDMLQL
jgi:hypothetical protein